MLLHFSPRPQIPRTLFSITSALFCTLAHQEYCSSRFFSFACALFVKNRGVWGYSSQIGTLLRLHLRVRHLFPRYRLQFAADDVRGKARAEEAAVDGSHFLFVDFAAVRPQLALD